MKVIYVHTGKNLEFKKFEKNWNAPTGWIRLDILKDKLKNDKGYRSKFTKKEIKIIDDGI